MRVPPSANASKFTCTRISSIGPLLYLRTMPNEYGYVHSNGSSSHSTLMIGSFMRIFLVPITLLSISTSGWLVSRLKRLVSEAKGQIASGVDLRFHCQEK